MKRSIIPVFIPHMGCPHRCVFCDQRQISGKRSAPDVRAEIGAALEKTERSGISVLPQVAFYGGSFTAIEEREQTEFLAVGAEFVHQGRVASLRCSTRPDAIDGAVVQRLKKYHMQTVELGAQSMDDGVLLRAGRGHTAADTVRAARMLKAEGFELVLQMMTGLPGDTPEKSLRTAEELIALEPAAVRIYPTVVLPGTGLEKLWREGKYRPETTAEAAALCGRLLGRFEEAGIPVIRLGLNPSRGLEEQVLDGPYHPAFGELAAGELWLSRIREKLGTERRSGVVLELTVPPHAVSAAVGQHRRNVQALQAEYGFGSVRIRAGEALSVCTVSPGKTEK